MHQLLREYLSYGYRLHPLKPGAKVPILQNWPERAAHDEATVCQWLAEFPGCNWGIATGDGFAVLDIDPAALDAGWPGEARRRELKATGCPLVQTPRGGFHLYFRANWPNSVGVIASGVDTKGPRGYVVAPPSVVNAKSYRWLRPLVSIDQLPLPPEWLDTTLKAAAKAIEHPPTPKSAEEIARENSMLCEGQRNVGLTRLAGRLRRQGFSQDEITAALLAANQIRCRPPLPEREVLAIAKSMARYPAGGGSGSSIINRAWRHAISTRLKKRRSGR